jgi:hypothetical protein
MTYFVLPNTTLCPTALTIDFLYILHYFSTSKRFKPLTYRKRLLTISVCAIQFSAFIYLSTFNSTNCETILV